MPDCYILIIFGFAVVVFMYFSLSRDKDPRSLLGDRSWSRQTRYMFWSGVVLVLALVCGYVLIRLTRWAVVHWF